MSRHPAEAVPRLSIQQAASEEVGRDRIGRTPHEGKNMTSATDPHPDLLAEPSARTFPLAQLVSLIREGKVRIPHFQRGLRWGTPDAVALIDSVLREIYDRTNNAGKRLTRGLRPSTEATTFETIQADIRDRPRQGQLDLDVILPALARACIGTLELTREKPCRVS